MTIEAAQCIAESHPDLLYIQITAVATALLVIATIGMIVWQIKAQEKANKIGLSMRLMEQYDSMQMRENRKTLASVLQSGGTPGAIVMETVLDVLETIAELDRRNLLDAELIENTFSLSVRHWWCALEQDVTRMRNEFQDVTIYEEVERLACQYIKSELAHHRNPTINQERLSKFLMSELQSINTSNYSEVRTV